MCKRFIKCSKMQYYKILFCLVFSILISVSSSYSGFAASQPRELNKVHSYIQVSDNCLLCHDTGNKINVRKCLVCHIEISERIKSSSGYHKDKTEECQDCHQEHRGKNSKLIEFDPKNFDHKETGYTLVGAHQKISNCSECHSGPNSIKKKFFTSYLLRSQKCSACHPDIHNNMYPVCVECHSINDWSVDIWMP